MQSAEKQTALARRPLGYRVTPSPRNTGVLLQRKPFCSCGGGCPNCRAVAPDGLEVSEPDGQDEREADRVAEEVMGMAGPNFGKPPHIRPLGLEGEGNPQREAGPRIEAAEADVKPRSGGGHPLPDAERRFFEPRFGRDFSAVRVHTDARAAVAAESLGALAFTTGRDIVFAGGLYSPQSSDGRRLLAHELTHVVQQTQPAPGGLGSRPATGGTPGAPPFAQAATGVRIQRLVRPSLLMGCGAGQNPFTADRRAAQLLTAALARIDAASAARPADPANADVVAVGNAMRTAFRLDPANDDNWNLPAPRFGLPLIRRRLEIARDYLESVVFTYNCCTVGGACPATCGTCAAGEEAFVCGGDTSIITLCPLFWTRGRDQRGRILAHEVLHIDFGFINDWGQPDRANAHCYAQFTALLNGFNSPAGFRCH